MRRFSKAGGADSTIHTYAKCLLELALHDYSLVFCKPFSNRHSCHIYGRTEVTDIVHWNETMELYSEYKFNELELTAGKLAIKLFSPPQYLDDVWQPLKVDNLLNPKDNDKK